MSRGLCLLLLVLDPAQGAKKKTKKAKAAVAKAEFKLSGPSGEYPIDSRGGADNDNVSPKLEWSGVPKNTQSFALLMDSELAGENSGKAGRQTHWVVYDIPNEVTEMRDELSGAGASSVGRLGMKDDAGQAPVVVDPMGSIDGYVDPEIKAMEDMIHGAVDASFEDENRAKEGATSFGGTYYSGPTVQGTVVTFKLYALSKRLQLPRGATRDEVLAAMKGSVLGKTTSTSRLA